MKKAWVKMGRGSEGGGDGREMERVSKKDPDVVCILPVPHDE